MVKNLVGSWIRVALLSTVLVLVFPAQVKGQGDRVRVLSANKRSTILQVVGGPNSGSQYEITLVPRAKDVPRKVLLMTGSLIRVAGLVPDTDYEVSVSSMRGGVKGPPGPTTILTTHPDKPSGPPQNLKVSDCGAHYFQLIWQPPAPSDINDRDGIRNYTLYLDKKYINTTSDTEYTFDGLKKNRTYFVEVLAENDQGIADRNHAARRMVTTLNKRSGFVTTETSQKPSTSIHLENGNTEDNLIQSTTTTIPPSAAAPSPSAAAPSAAVPSPLPSAASFSTGASTLSALSSTSNSPSISSTPPLPSTPLQPSPSTLTSPSPLTSTTLLSSTALSPSPSPLTCKQGTFPRSVRLLKTSSYTISYLVIPPPNPLVQYRVQFIPTISVLPMVEAKVTSSITVQSGVIPDVDYRIVVTRESSSGEWCPYIATTTTPPDKPGGPPQNIRVTDVGHTHIVITWDLPLPSEINDRHGINLYRIILNNTEVGETPNQYYTFTKLFPGSQHRVKIYPINDQGVGRMAGTITVETLPPPDPATSGDRSIYRTPTSSSIFSSSVTSAVITSIDLTNRISLQDHSTVYTSSAPMTSLGTLLSSSTPLPTSMLSSSPSILLPSSTALSPVPSPGIPSSSTLLSSSDIKPFSTIHIMSEAQTTAYASSTPLSTVCTTPLPDTPPTLESPNVRILSITTNTITCHITTSDGKQVQYEITLTPQTHPQYINTTITMVNTTNPSLTGLAPDVGYVMEVRSIRGCQQSGRVIFVVRTLKDVPTGPPTNIRIVHLESNRAEIAWDRPHPTHINDKNGIKAYRVILNNNRTELTVNSSIVYFGLDPDTKYHVEVIPINSVGISGRKYAGKFNFTTLTKLCDLVKMEHPSFHYGQDGRTYLCKAAWNTNKCSLTREGPEGVDCLPRTSRLSNLPFKCRAVRGAGRVKLQLKVPKDIECQLVQADTP